MTFKQIAEKYFSELKKEVAVGLSGEASAELSYRTSLDNFFKSVASEIDPEISTILEPRNQNKIGRPDWRFHNSESMGVYGYVEAKGLDENSEINIKSYKSQVQKYLELGNPVILTDGIDFVLFENGKAPFKVSLCKKKINWENPELDLSLEVLFKRFFGNVGYRIVSENQLINEVAKRAKLLTAELFELLSLDDDECEDENERTTLHLLSQLKSTAEQNHDKTLLSKDKFASFISQILTFGLLYSHRVVDNTIESPKEKYDKIHDFWFSLLEEDYSNKLIPFRTLVTGLKSELDSNLSRLGVWYDDLRRLLSFIKLSKEQVEIPNFHELYETFLSIYDPKTRFDYGAFYTPRFLAFYSVELVKKIVASSMPNIKLDKGTHKIIDPCCGTGTFIEAILDNLTLSKNSKIIGFEILPAPYALANYRVSMLRAKYPDNIKIVLTNTLSDNLFEEIKSEGDDTIGFMLLREQKIAYNLASPPLTIIIGNPPSSDAFSKVENEGRIIKELINDFRPSAEGRKARQNTQKQLGNEFVKFLRWTIDRSLKSKPSIFSLIIPSTFAKHPSYKFARKFLFENISEIWILEFDQDKRTGANESNVFPVLQGRLLLIGVVADKKPASAVVKYKNICDLTRKEKVSYFESTDIDLDEWIELTDVDDEYSFKPADEYDSELYNRFWPLTNDSNSGIFLRHCSSLKLAPTHLLVHASKGQLKRRSKFISKPENDYATIKEKWYSGQTKPPPASKINDAIKKLLVTAVDSDKVLKYSYRPFLETSVLLDDDLLEGLSQMEGGGTRDRPEIRAAYNDTKVFGFAVAPAPEDIGSTLHKFSSFCWHIPDNDLSTRGNAHIFCNYFPDYKKKKDWDPTLKGNINSDVLSGLAVRMSLKVEDLIDPLTFYSYSILSSNYFLNKFAGKLFSVAGEWPRVPVTADKDLFIELSKRGKELAKLESLSSPESLVETASFSFHKYTLKENAVKLLDSEGNVAFELNDVSSDILEFSVSGYNVLREWLKMHSYSYYRKDVGGQEISELKLLVKNIETYLQIVSDIDLLVEKVLSTELLDFTS